MWYLPNTLGKVITVPEVKDEELTALAERRAEQRRQAIKSFGNGPSNIKFVALEKADSAPVVAVQTLGSIKPTNVVAASLPESPYARALRNK